ncbi:Rieske 2Fe-2S domain-containing protein [Dactylosporangium vinaceum]|uniref:Rieske 2Fe-2S domain-containing protein n=1 Tax=Dactylosporangium vinaceum TaxID=53362 RepID=A0ABV5MB31_9ACTN|nr:Rieske 2Fe-2S domain-containing protein [Dactylosporangium vinaceum]UAB98308.1 Rieske 2Fe-2S domain-containing protein [Dactylosporangium vinaceum]
MSQWTPVARSADVTTRPLAVELDGLPFVLVRFADGGPVRAFADRCPHRLVPLSAATPTGGTLRCAYHGWEFGPDGRCVAIPSAPGQAVPPRADLPPGPAVQERDGRVWLDRATPAPGDPPELCTNEDSALRRAWHPVGLVAELPFTAELLGEAWSVDEDLHVEPAPHAVTTRWGLVWLAPQEPLTELFDDPDREDRQFAGAWLPPARTSVAAAVVADNFLDVAHFPFVHAGTFGAGEERAVPEYTVQGDPDGCRSVQEQWFDNPEDPGVLDGVRPVRQRRRATYVYRAPFQLMLRLEELDAGAVKTILFFAQPESLTRTRIYTKMLLWGIGGAERPGPDVVARECAFEEAVLAEDLALQSTMTLTGLPLRMRDELHVRADRLGVALRRELVRFRERAANPGGAGE